MSAPACVTCMANVLYNRKSITVGSWWTHIRQGFSFPFFSCIMTFYWRGKGRKRGMDVTFIRASCLGYWAWFGAILMRFSEAPGSCCCLGRLSSNSSRKSSWLFKNVSPLHSSSSLSFNS
jgi:hypothetical protein